MLEKSLVKMKLLLVCLGITIALQMAAQAQTVRGVISGLIKDAAGNPVASASITITSQETNAKRTATADAHGEFIITLVPPGTYHLEARGGPNLSYRVITPLEMNQEMQLELTLTAGGDRVEVSATSPLVRAETSEMGGVIENRMVIGLPLDGRRFYDLCLLLPGVVPPAEGSAGSVRGAFALNVNGAREDANNFLLDGAYNADPKLNGVGTTPSVDAVQEFEVASSTYDTSFGRNAGGQISVVMRSGGNSIHGTAYEFFNNAVLNGTNFFAPSGVTPQYQRNQFGGTVGGPVVRNKTFFFGDYEGMRLSAGQPLVSNVPTAAERVGDFMQSSLPVIDPITGQPIPGNKIPSYYLNPVGLAIAALYPLPTRNVPGANYVSSPNEIDDRDQGDLRIDHAFRRGDDLFARYSVVDDRLLVPFAGSSGDALVPGYGLNVPSRAQNAMLGETHLFTPTLLNDVRLVFNRVSNGDFQENQGTSINQQVGLPELTSNPRDWGLSLVSVTGFSPIGDDPHQPRTRHHRHLSNRRQRLLDSRPASGEVRNGYPHSPAERLPRH